MDLTKQLSDIRYKMTGTHIPEEGIWVPRPQTINVG